MYYLRTKPSVDAIKFTIDPKLVKQQELKTANFKLLQHAASSTAKVAPAAPAAPITPCMSGSVAFEVATSGMQKLTVGSPVKKRLNPRVEKIVSATAYVMTAEEIRAERAAKEKEIRQWERDQEQGSCKGGMCSA
jgi:hypothetical protein